MLLAKGLESTTLTGRWQAIDGGNLKMKFRFLVSIALLTFLLLPFVAADPIQISGKVLLPGGTALPEAEVSLLPLLDPLTAAIRTFSGASPEPAAWTLTDDDGRFKLMAPGSGLWRVRISAPGFVPLESRLTPLLETHELPDAELVDDTGIVVRVTNQDGQPVNGAMVRSDTERGRYRFSQQTWQNPMRHGVTGEDGSVRLSRAERESISIQIYAAGYGFQQRRNIRGTVASFDLAPAVPQTIEVRDSHGTLMAGVAVHIGRHAMPAGMTGANGRLTLRPAISGATDLTCAASDGRRLDTTISAVSPTDETPHTYTLPDQSVLNGRMIDKITLEAISGGLVWDAEDPMTAVTTDNAGGFTLSGPSRKRLQITSGAQGYLSGRVIEYQLMDDGRAGPVLVLAPAAAIEGSVLDQDGKPISGAEVTLDVRQAPGSFMRIEIGGGGDRPRVLTNSRGKFRLSPVDPENNYTLGVSSEGFAPGDQKIDDLEPYRTKTGVRIELNQGRSVTGIVVDSDGNPLTECFISMQAAATESGGPMALSMGNDSQQGAFETASDAEGLFEIAGLPVGKFDLTAKRSGFASHSLPAIDVTAEEKPIDLGEITLQAGERLQGVVLDRSGQPVEGVEVRVKEPGPMMMMMGGGGGEESEPDGLTDIGGWYQLVDLSPDTGYNISFSRKGYIQGNLSGVQAPSGEPLEITLDPSSKIIGHVLDPDGEPLANAQVSLERTRKVQMGGMAMVMMMMESAQTDRAGRFIFEDQEPGKINLSAVATGYQKADLTDLEIPQGEDLEDVLLPLPVGAVLDGRVLTPDGKPAIGASVMKVEEGAQEMIHDMGGNSTDGNGNFRLVGLAPGTYSIQARHEAYPRTVKEITLKEGHNKIELMFTGGQEVSGRIIDTGGEPISNASIQLASAGHFGGGPSAQSDHDGRFEIAGVQDGDYNLLVSAEDHAPSKARQINVAGQPVSGVEISLETGTAIFGRISGIQPEKFARVNVNVEGSRLNGFSDAKVNHTGDYRLEHLRPGTYNVTARLSNSGLQAREQITVEAGQPEVRLDLQFGGGVTLSGQAVQGDTPVAGAMLYAENLDTEHSGWSSTDHKGNFSIEGLDPGSYKLSLQDMQTGLAYRETVELATSREILLEVPTASVVGRVVDSADNRPLAGVTVKLESIDPDSSKMFPDHVTTSDLNGRFIIDNVGDGNWTLTADKQGYGAVSESVTVQFERASETLKLALDPTDGLVLEARLPSGAIPDQLTIAVLDPAGSLLTGGNFATGENGKVRISTVPAGSWELLVSASGSAVSNLRADAPGDTLMVGLQPACRLVVNVPELADSETIAMVRLRGSDGLPFRSPGFGGMPRSEWRVRAGRTELNTLPPGNWTINVNTSDGRSWTGSATTTAGLMAEATLE
jgi:protocatechuate 3,4-dioxygenase beta subunit